MEVLQFGGTLVDLEVILQVVFKVILTGFCSFPFLWLKKKKISLGGGDQIYLFKKKCRKKVTLVIENPFTEAHL